MPCTTVLVGRKASNDGSTMIARTDDGHFDIKKTIVYDPAKEARVYKSVISKVAVELPETGMKCTISPNVVKNEGLWPATGINEANVGMTATETITSNPRVLSADPLVKYVKAKKRGEKDIPGGIGEEDFVVLVLPYIRSAREGVLRLGALLEQYGTYESNGIGFNDANEIWWLETIGGHHWLARKVPDEAVVIHPNQFGTDGFDFEDALGAGEAHLCSRDLKAFMEENDIDLNTGAAFDPRKAFGSVTDADHIYNTPRGWFMGRYLAPTKYKWDGPDADFTPESDNIPQWIVPERKMAVEDVKYLLSSHYQGTPYDPYSAQSDARGRKYRTIGINRTGVMTICQIRGKMPEEIRSVEWICYGSTTFDAMVPVYPVVDKLPKYLSEVRAEVSTENFYWASRVIAALSDSCYGTAMPHVERYQAAMFTEGRRLIREYDAKMIESGDYGMKAEANEAICRMAKELTTEALGNVLSAASENMKNGFSRGDN